MGSNWDSVQYNSDDTISAKFYVDQVDYAICYDIFNREPKGDKYDMVGEVVRNGKQYVVKVEGKPVTTIETRNTQLIGRLNRAGTLRCDIGVKWRAYDKEPRFMVIVTLKNV